MLSSTMGHRHGFGGWKSLEGCRLLGLEGFEGHFIQMLPFGDEIMDKNESW